MKAVLAWFLVLLIGSICYMAGARYGRGVLWSIVMVPGMIGAMLAFGT